MNARRMRHRTARRYLGPTCLAGSGPANLAMIDRAMRKGRRQLARKDRRAPRPLLHPALRVTRVPLRDPKAIAAFQRFTDTVRAAMARTFAVPPSLLVAGRLVTAR